MYGLHTALAYDIARLQHDELIARYQRASLLNRLAIESREPSRTTTLRRTLGSALVRVGEWVHGGDAALPASYVSGVPKNA